MKKAKGRIICKVYYYVLKIIIMFVWALTESGRIHKKLVANVTSGERNWKPEVKSEGDLTFHCLLFIFLTFCIISLYYLGEWEGKETTTYCACQEQQLFPQGSFWRDALMEGAQRDLFPRHGLWNPCLPLSWLTGSCSQVHSTIDCPHRQGIPDFLFK